MIKLLSSDEIQDHLWTVLSAGLSAVYATLLILMTTRFVSLTVAGILSYAAAVSELLRILVMFGVRGYQSTDMKQEFNFNVYLGLRTLTALLASIVLAVFLILGRFEPFRAAVMLLFFFTYLTDMYADVFMGDLQQKGKMRIAGRMRATGFASALIAFAIASFTTQTLLLPLAFAGFAICCVNIVWIWVYRSHFGAIRVKIDVIAIKKLAVSTYPIAISSLLFIYLYHAQKYYLGAFGLDEAVAIITILMLPAMLLNLFCIFFFMGAELTYMAGLFTSGQLRRFAIRVNQQLLIVVALCIPFMIFIYFSGIFLLSWLYGVDLSVYKEQLMLLSSGSVFLAIVSVLNAVLIVMRRQKTTMFCMMAVACVTGPAMWFLVSRYGLTGAAFSNLVIFVPMAVLLYVVYRVALKI